MGTREFLELQFSVVSSPVGLWLHLHLGLIADFTLGASTGTGSQPGAGWTLPTFASTPWLVTSTLNQSTHSWAQLPCSCAKAYTNGKLHVVAAAWTAVGTHPADILSQSVAHAWSGMHINHNACTRNVNQL